MAENTRQEVKRFTRQSDSSDKRKEEEDKDNLGGDKGETPTKHTPKRSNLTSPACKIISLRRLWNVEHSLAFGIEMLPAFNKSLPSSPSVQASLSLTLPASSSFSGSQAYKSSDQRCELNLDFLPPVDEGLFKLLQDANLFCNTNEYSAAVSSLCNALQLSSKGHMLKDMQCTDPEDINLVFSYIQARLVVCYLKMKKPQLALEHAHRSIQLNPSHFQNHLRQAVVYREMGKPWLAAKSVLTADWLYCIVLGGTERHISTQLKLYWQAMLYKAQLVKEGICVMYTPYSGYPTAEDIRQAEEAFAKQHGAFTDFIYTDSRGGHVLPQTVDWLSAPAPPQQYFITLGFRKREDGLLLKKIYSRKWLSLSDTARKGELLSPKQQQKDEMKIQMLCDMYEKVLPILDLMQATQIHSGVYVGSGLIEWLQYGSLLHKLSFHREHSIILHRCQAHLFTAPHLPQLSTQQENTLMQALLTDIMDELGGRRSSTERVWNKMLKVGRLENLIHSVEKKYMHKKAQTRQHRQIGKVKAKVCKRSNIYRELFPVPTTATRKL